MLFEIEVLLLFALLGISVYFENALRKGHVKVELRMGRWISVICTILILIALALGVLPRKYVAESAISLLIVSLIVDICGKRPYLKKLRRGVKGGGKT